MIGVTGGCGFIGTHLCEALLEQGERVRILDPHTPSATLSACDHLGSSGTSMADIEAFVDGCRGIVHLGGVSRSGLAQQAPLECIQANVMTSAMVLDASRQCERPPWILMASSRSAEATTRDVYAASKRCMETLAHTYAHAYALRIACVRLGDVFGSTRDHSDKVLPRFAKSILAKRPVELLDDNIAFDFIHIEDVVDQLRGAIKRLEVASEATFIGLRYSSGRRWTLRELAGALGVASDQIVTVDDSKATRTRNTAAKDPEGDPGPDWALEITAKTFESELRRLLDAMRCVA